MKKLRFEYSMELKLSSPVNSHYFALRCVPGDSLRQKITLEKCLVTPADYTSASSDGFGNLKISGCCRAPHDTFGYCIAGTAETKGMIVQKCPLHPMYRYPSQYTQFEPEIAEIAEKIKTECRKGALETTMEKAVCAMDYLYTHFEYVPGVTDVETTAAGALRLE